jgi:hypothetical protein
MSIFDEVRSEELWTSDIVVMIFTCAVTSGALLGCLWGLMSW